MQEEVSQVQKDLLKYLRGDCKICVHRQQYNTEHPNKSGLPCCDCDELDMICWELDEQRLKELL